MNNRLQDFMFNPISATRNVTPMGQNLSDTRLNLPINTNNYIQTNQQQPRQQQHPRQRQQPRQQQHPRQRQQPRQQQSRQQQSRQRQQQPRQQQSRQQQQQNKQTTASVGRPLHFDINKNSRISNKELTNERLSNYTPLGRSMSCPINNKRPLDTRPISSNNYSDTNNFTIDNLDNIKDFSL